MHLVHNITEVIPDSRRGKPDVPGKVKNGYVTLAVRLQHAADMDRLVIFHLFPVKYVKKEIPEISKG